MLDVAKSMQCKISMTKLMETDPNIRPYFAALVVSVLATLGEHLVIPRGLAVKELPTKEFQDYLIDMSSRSFDAYGKALSSLPGLGPSELEAVT